MEEIKNRREGTASIYRDIVEVVGEDVAKISCKNFRGRQVVFPNKLYSSNFIAQRIREEYDGKDAKGLALKHDFTERWVRTILKPTK